MFHFDYKKSRKRYKTQLRKREAEKTLKNQEERLARAQGASLSFVAVTAGFLKDDRQEPTRSTTAQKGPRLAYS